MLKRFFKLFSDRKYWVRQIVVAGISGAISWIIGDALVPNGGVVAAIVSTLIIRISLHKSLREGIGQIVGTTVGAAVSLAAVSIFDFGAIAIGITVFICAVLARFLRLGEIASVNVPVVAMIIISPGLSENTVLHRLGVTVIGAVVAIVFSYFSHPQTPIERTYTLVNKIGIQGAELLAEMRSGRAHV